MDNSKVESAELADITAPPSSEFPYIPEFERVIEGSTNNIVGKIKWQLVFTNKKLGEKKVPFDRKHIQFLLDGLIRADLSEQLSEILQISDCNTVFSSGQDQSNLRVVSFKKITGGKSKEDVLAFAVRKSLEEKPPQGVIDQLQKLEKDEQKRQVDFDQISQEIIEGYSSKGSGINSGIFYGDTAIPDAALLDSAQNIVGFVEVKAYFPNEFDSLIKHLQFLKAQGKLSEANAALTIEREGMKMDFHLGVDVFAEIKFIDALRTAGWNLERLGTQMPILLRFPNDISDESLIEYGHLLRELKIPNVVIQKLPFSSSELSIRSKKFVRDNIEKFKTRDQKMAYSDREIAVLESYILK